MAEPVRKELYVINGMYGDHMYGSASRRIFGDRGENILDERKQRQNIKGRLLCQTLARYQDLTLAEEIEKADRVIVFDDFTERMIEGDQEMQQHLLALREMAGPNKVVALVNASTDVKHPRNIGAFCVDAEHKIEGTLEEADLLLPEKDQIMRFNANRIPCINLSSDQCREEGQREKFLTMLNHIDKVLKIQE